MLKLLRNMAVIFLIVVAVLGAGITYMTKCAKQNIKTCYSDDKIYCLRIYQVGEPVWSFGPTNCRIVLHKGKKKIDEEDFCVSNDGVPVRKYNFQVEWGADGVTVIANGDEGGAEKYKLYFDKTN